MQVQIHLEMKNLLIRQQELNYQSGFEEKDIDKRTNPALIFDGPRSIIAIALAYPSRMKNPPLEGKEGRGGESFAVRPGE